MAGVASSTSKHFPVSPGNGSPLELLSTETASREIGWMDQTAKHKLAILTNILAPYRVPLFHRLASSFELEVLLSGNERTRSDWLTPEASAFPLSVRKSWGITREHSTKGESSDYDTHYFHFNPGYLMDLIVTRPDALLTAEMGLRTIIALLYAKLTGVPVWIWWGGTLHTERRIGKLRKLVRCLLVSVADRWISYGETSTDYLISIGVANDRVLQIQNCVDEELFEENVPPLFSFTPRPVLLSAGQMIGRKGLDRLLMAAADCQRRGYEFSLLLVGDGPDRQRLIELSKSLCLHNVHFKRGVSPHQMPSVYRSADCFVFPTLEDVWGLVVNEALWSGIPVLCSVYAGCANELVPQENLFDPLDQEDFVRVLQRAVEKRLAPADTSPLKTCGQVAGLIADEIHGVIAG